MRYVPAFIAGVCDEFPAAALTVDWFHVVQLFTKGMDDVRKLEARKEKLPEGSHWATLKALETKKTDTQEAALQELFDRGLATATAFRVKEMLRWVREADTKQGSRWRATNFLRKAWELVAEGPLLAPMRKALTTFEEHLPRILRRWESLLSTARLESLNGLFQAARAKARGYRNVEYFITMIYLIGAPITALLEKPIPHIWPRPGVKKNFFGFFVVRLQTYIRRQPDRQRPDGVYALSVLNTKSALFRLVEFQVFRKPGRPFSHRLFLGNLG